MPNTTITLGPLLIPVSVLGLMTSLFTTTWVVSRIAPRLGFDRYWGQHVVQMSFLIGITAARLSFVARFWESYLDAPWTILFLWQPGYSVGTGTIAGLVFAAWRIQQTRVLWQRQSISLLGSGILTGVVVFYLVVGLVGVLSDRDAIIQGTAISDFTLVDLGGNTVHWSDLEGKGTILNFWATWCRPCRREMPLLEQVHRIYKSRGLNVIGISVGESKDTVRRYIDSIGVSYPIWVNDNTRSGDQTQYLFDKYGGVGLPTTVFADHQGVIREIYVGELSRGFIDSEVKKLLF